MSSVCAKLLGTLPCAEPRCLREFWGVWATAVAVPVSTDGSTLNPFVGDDSSVGNDSLTMHMKGMTVLSKEGLRLIAKKQISNSNFSFGETTTWLSRVQHGPVPMQSSVYPLLLRLPSQCLREMYAH